MFRNLYALFVATAFAISPAHAQGDAAWPSKPVRFIVPFPPGGPTDAIARALADQLRLALNQPVLVENRPGAAGNMGIAEALRSGKDGHTIVLITTTTLALNPHLYSSLGYDEKEMTPVALVAKQTYTLLVRKGLSTDLKTLLAQVKAKPKTFTAATGNTTSLIGNYMLQKAAGGEILSVPYKGDADALTGLMGGQTDMYLTVSPQLSSLVESGRLNAVAVAGPQRNPLLPHVPTFAEAGVPGFFDLSPWYGVGVHSSAPAAVVERLNKEINRIVATTEFKSRLYTMGAQPMDTTAQQAVSTVKADRARWQEPIKSSGATVQ